MNASTATFADECPNEAISQGASRSMNRPEQVHCECVGHYDTPQCVRVCPVDCIPKDSAHEENTEQLWVKYEKLTGNQRPG